MPNPTGVHLEHRPPMDGYEINGVFCKEREKYLKGFLRVEAKTGLHRELPWNGVSQRPENFIDTGQVAQQSSARALAVDHRGGTAEVQIDRRDGMLGQLLCRTNQRRDVVANHLSDNGAAGRILRDRG